MKGLTVVGAGLLAMGCAAKPTVTEKKASVAEPDTRSIEMTVVAEATPDEVFALWSSAEGTRRFFSPAANIELRPGGPYEILFLMDAPEGERGCEGCQVVAFDPERWLTFTWNSPPSLPEVRHEQTNVIVELNEVEEGTEVRLLAIGWGTGESWLSSYEYFDSAWGRVLQALAEHCAPQGEDPA